MVPIIGSYVNVGYASGEGGTRKIILTTREAGSMTNDTDLYDVNGIDLAGGDGYTAAVALPDNMIIHEQNGYKRAKILSFVPIKGDNHA